MLYITGDVNQEMSNISTYIPSMGRCARRNKTEDVISPSSYMTYYMPQAIETTMQSYILLSLYIV